MRTPTALIACLLSAAAACNATIAPAGASLRVRAPLGRAVTLGVYPALGLAGEPALLAGRVSGPGAAGAIVTLWQRPPGAARASVLAQVTAESSGAFLFTRANAPLDQTTSLYAAAIGLRSRTVREPVAASVTLATSTATVTTGSPAALSGHVSPAGHAGEPVLVQQRSPSGWATIAHAVIGADGSFAAAPPFAAPGAVALRALFVGDAHNASGVSDPLDLLVQPPAAGALSLVASTDPLTVGQSVTLSGTVGVTTGTAAGIPVTLLAGPDAADEQPVATTRTDGAGNFSFTQTPSATTLFAVRAAAQRSASTVVGVQASVTLSAGTLTAPLGALQTINGTVAGASPGTDVALQLLGGDGLYHSIARGRLTAPASPGVGAGFSFTTTLTDPGSDTYRVLAGDDAQHQSGVSLPLTVLVTPRAAQLVAAALGQA